MKIQHNVSTFKNRQYVRARTPVLGTHLAIAFAIHLAIAFAIHFAIAFAAVSAVAVIHAIAHSVTIVIHARTRTCEIVVQ